MLLDRHLVGIGKLLTNIQNIRSDTISVMLFAIHLYVLMSGRGYMTISPDPLAVAAILACEKERSTSRRHRNIRFHLYFSLPVIALVAVLAAMLSDFRSAVFVHSDTPKRAGSPCGRDLHLLAMGSSPRRKRILFRVHSIVKTLRLSEAVPIMSSTANRSAMIKLTLLSVFMNHEVNHTLSSRSNGRPFASEILVSALPSRLPGTDSWELAPIVG